MMREWSVAGQEALLAHLACILEQRPSAAEPPQLWSARKGERVLTCVAVHLPIGIDVRLLEDGEFRRTQLCKDAPTAKDCSENWRIALHTSGWSTDEPRPTN